MFFKSGIKVALACALVGIGMVGSYSLGAHSQAKVPDPPAQAKAEAPVAPQGQAPLVVTQDDRNHFGEAMAGAIAGNLVSNALTQHQVTSAARPPVRLSVFAQPKALVGTKPTPATRPPKPLSAQASLVSREERVIQRRLESDGVSRHLARQATAELRANTTLPAAQPTRVTSILSGSTSRSFTRVTPTRSIWSFSFRPGRR